MSSTPRTCEVALRRLLPLDPVPDVRVPMKETSATIQREWLLGLHPVHRQITHGVFRIMLAAGHVAPITQTASGYM